jgi:[ribosomal protein S5]-alanine N-acetyltransferase
MPVDIFPELHTQRLLLRRITVEDIPALVKYASNRRISDNIINIPYPYEEPQAVFRISYVVQGFKNKQRFVFAIILKETQEMIGEISLHLAQQDKAAELGYWVGEPFWGKGMATEAVKAVLTFGFERLGLAAIFAECHVENMASQKVVSKNGMKRRGINGNVVQFYLARPEQ